MLLQQARRATEDIDFALIIQPGSRQLPQQVFRATVQKADVSRRTSAVPDASQFKRAVETVAELHGLPNDWMNDEAAVYYYDDAPEADVAFWRSFGKVLFVYLPTREYILATKIAAGRRKDRGDIQLLLRELHIQTRSQVQVVLDRFLLPEAQAFWEVQRKLNQFFR